MILQSAVLVKFAAANAYRTARTSEAPAAAWRARREASHISITSAIGPTMKSA
jgi:hypothetical protein